MTAEAAMAVRSWVVGAYTVTMSIPKPKPGTVMSATCEWAPSEPSKLSTEEWKTYRLGRNKALASLAEELGINVAVLEV